MLEGKIDLVIILGLYFRRAFKVMFNSSVMLRRSAKYLQMLWHLSSLCAGQKSVPARNHVKFSLKVQSNLRY